MAVVEEQEGGGEGIGWMGEDPRRRGGEEDGITARTSALYGLFA